MGWVKLEVSPLHQELSLDLNLSCYPSALDGLELEYPINQTFPYLAIISHPWCYIFLCFFHLIQSIKWWYLPYMTYSQVLCWLAQSVYPSWIIATLRWLIIPFSMFWSQPPLYYRFHSWKVQFNWKNNEQYIHMIPSPTIDYDVFILKFKWASDLGSYHSLTEAYNVDIVDQFKSKCRDLLDMWPDVMSDDPLMIRDGGQEVGWWSLSCQNQDCNIFHCSLHQSL